MGARPSVARPTSCSGQTGKFQRAPTRLRSEVFEVRLRRDVGDVAKIADRAHAVSVPVEQDEVGRSVSAGDVGSEREPPFENDDAEGDVFRLVSAEVHSDRLPATL